MEERVKTAYKKKVSGVGCQLLCSESMNTVGQIVFDATGYQFTWAPSFAQYWLLLFDFCRAHY